MRIGVTSDIHVDISPANSRIVEHIAFEVERAELDVFIICGDISPDIRRLSNTLSAFENNGCKKLFVAGNHDIWLANPNDNVTSEKKYSLITALCKEYGFHHLGDSPVVVGRTGFCGTIGWYNYSYKSDKYPISEKSYMRKTFRGSVWNDVNYAKWEGSDPEVASRFESELQAQIDFLRDQVSRIIVATHHVPFRECIVYRNELPWDFFNAFMGSAGLGRICVDEPLVTHALFGHSHFECVKRVSGVWAICSPVGYLIDPPPDLQRYAQSRLRVLDLPDTTSDPDE